MEPRPRATLLVLLSAVIWGSSFVVIKLGLGGSGGGAAAAPPVTSAFLRFAVAAAASTAVLRARGPLRAGALADPLVVAIAASNAFGYSLQYIGLVATNPAVASLLANLGIVVTAVLSALVLKERLTLRTGLAVMLAFVGGSVLATRGDLASLGDPAFGAALAIIVASVFWSVYVVLNKLALNRRAWSDAELTWAIFVLTAASTLPLALALEGVPTLNYPLAAWGSTAYTGVVCSSLAFLLYMGGLKELTATATAVLTVAEILVAFALTVAVFGESFTAVTAGGALLVVAGILLAGLASRESGGPPGAADPGGGKIPPS